MNTLKALNTCYAVLFLLLLANNTHAEDERHNKSRVGIDTLSDQSVERQNNQRLLPGYAIVVEDQDAIIIRRAADQVCKQEYPSKGY